jgi:hypothetical protein
MYAALGGTIGVAALIPAAVTCWHHLIDWADEHTQRPSSRPIGAHRPAIGRVRVPIAAITATPHWEAVDQLGPWNPSQHQPVPAYLAGETSVNTVNSGALR